MVAVKEISWEEASSPGFEQTTRQAWRTAVADIADKARQVARVHWPLDSAVRWCWPTMWSCCRMAPHGGLQTNGTADYPWSMAM